MALMFRGGARVVTRYPVWVEQIAGGKKVIVHVHKSEGGAIQLCGWLKGRGYVSGYEEVDVSCWGKADRELWGRYRDLLISERG